MLKIYITQELESRGLNFADFEKKDLKALLNKIDNKKSSGLDLKPLLNDLTTKVMAEVIEKEGMKSKNSM